MKTELHGFFLLHIMSFTNELTEILHNIRQFGQNQFSSCFSYWMGIAHIWLQSCILMGTFGAVRLKKTHDKIA